MGPARYRGEEVATPAGLHRIERAATMTAWCLIATIAGRDLAKAFSADLSIASVEALPETGPLYRTRL
ncbi:hypothetical protein SMD10_06580 [Consotaella sp. CSK11QG-6]